MQAQPKIPILGTVLRMKDLPVSWSRRSGPHVLPSADRESCTNVVPVSRLPQPTTASPSGAGCSYKTMPSQGRAGGAGRWAGACSSKRRALTGNGILRFPTQETASDNVPSFRVLS